MRLEYTYNLLKYGSISIVNLFFCPQLVLFFYLIMAVFLFVFDHSSIFEHPGTHARYNKKNVHVYTIWMWTRLTFRVNNGLLSCLWGFIWYICINSDAEQFVKDWGQVYIINCTTYIYSDSVNDRVCPYVANDVQL